MTTPMSRRLFLGGTAALGGALAGGVPLAAASAGPAGAPLYGPSPGVAKLNANENPYGPSDSALVAIFEASRHGAYYVNASVKRLKAMIAERHGLTPEHVSLSSGSSGVLTYLARARLAQGRILGPDLFWDTTVKMAARQGGEVERLPPTADLGIDLDAMAAALTEDVALVQVTNPNNPTGRVLDGNALREFCRKAARRATVLVDEAYNELTDRPDYYSMVDLVREGHDVAVARTFSKIYGLAGLRVGYLLAAPETTAQVMAHSLGDYALNQAGIAAAVASYGDEAFLALSKARIVEGRERVLEAVQAAGLDALPSATNFVFVNLGDRNAETFREKMAARNVLIRGIYGRYHNWSRVSMGRLEDVSRYVDALPEVLEEMDRAPA